MAKKKATLPAHMEKLVKDNDISAVKKFSSNVNGMPVGLQQRYDPQLSSNIG